jgi:hypothetical protein
MPLAFTVPVRPWLRPSPPGIDADWLSAFKGLDTDGQGYLDGQLSVGLELVQC